MKKLNIVDYIPLIIVAICLAGGILVACHLQLAGLIVAGIALVVQIVLYRLKSKVKFNIYIVYWSLVACVAIFLLSILGFAGYTVWDIYTEHDVN